MIAYKLTRFLLLFAIYTENLIIIEGSKLRIVGGNVTTIEQHPWMVSIQFLRVHFCGGSIVNEDTIITAAHCFDDISNAVAIVAGTADLTQEGVSVRVESVLVHENYKAEIFDYDIAILKLSESLTFSNQIRPIALPDENTEIPDETAVITSGWGVTQEDATETSNILLDIEIYTINWETCREKLASDNEITDRMICAGYPKGGHDSCQADSGGALELNSTLIGIVSWGHGCGEADYPGVYTHVGRFRSWIKQHAGI